MLKSVPETIQYWAMREYIKVAQRKNGGGGGFDEVLTPAWQVPTNYKSNMLTTAPLHPVSFIQGRHIYSNCYVHI